MINRLKKIDFSDDEFWFINKIIKEQPDNLKKGLSLGNQSSQWFVLYYLDRIDRLVKEKLNLELNQKTQIGIAYNGIDFLGLNHILTGSGKVISKLRFSSKQRMRKHIKTIKKLKNKSIIDEEYINMRINSFKAHLKIF